MARALLTGAELSRAGVANLDGAARPAALPNGEDVNLSIESRNELPVQPGWMLPELSFDALRERAGCLAERRLIIAVLEDAIMCYQKYMFARGAHERRIFDQAESWLMRRDPNGRSHDSFSFEFICDALGLDPEGLREQLRKWRLEGVEVEQPYVSSRQRCRWRAVYREPCKKKPASRRLRMARAVAAACG